MRRLIIVLCSLIALAVNAMAQTSPDKVYRLRQEDVIRVQVFGQPQLSGDTITVGEDGNVTVPFAGSVRAEGRTTAELEEELFDIFVKRVKLRDPIVTVVIIKYRTLQAFVNGLFVRPGAFSIRPGDTVLTLVAQAGGLMNTAADRRPDQRRARLKRKGWNEEIPIDLYALIESGDLSQNYELKDGDVLEVPELENSLVTVLGAIQRPGAFAYRESMSLSDAVGLAGGEIPYRTRFSKTRILRRDVRRNEVQVINCDFVSFLTKNDISQNVRLQPGDVVFIPTSNSPDLQLIGSFLNTAFILNQVSTFFGIRN